MNTKEGFYVLCHIKKSTFSNERLVDFFGLDGPGEFYFDPGTRRYGCVTDRRNILIPYNDGWTVLGKEDLSSEGLVKSMVQPRFFANGSAKVVLSDNLSHSGLMFRVLQDDLSFVSREEIVVGRS